jgi:hypothetical protein
MSLLFDNEQCVKDYVIVISVANLIIYFLLFLALPLPFSILFNSINYFIPFS